MPGVAGFSGRLAESQAEAMCLGGQAQNACYFASSALTSPGLCMAGSDVQSEQAKPPAVKKMQLVPKTHQQSVGRTPLCMS